MKPTAKETADNPIDDLPGSERDLNPHELISCENDVRELVDEEDYDSTQAYQIALDAAKDIDKTIRTPRPLNFDGDSV